MFTSISADIGYLTTISHSLLFFSFLYLILEIPATCNLCISCEPLNTQVKEILSSIRDHRKKSRETREVAYTSRYTSKHLILNPVYTQDQ